ncbi:MAG TPA: DnaJ domain-containing protein [Chloroflexota bacterium]|jgi:hypothetical protein
MIAGTHPSLAELGELSPGLRRTFDRYQGTAMLSASSQELQRLRRHLFDACRIDPVDLTLFDHFPPDDRQVIVRELHTLVHERMRERQAEHARRVEAQAPVDALRRSLLSNDERTRLVELGIWAHLQLGNAELAESLVDRYFDLTTVERVRAFAANQEAVIRAFQEEVQRRLAEQRERRQWRSGHARNTPTLDANLAPCYAALGLRTGASRVDVCQAFRTLAKQHHPDLGGSELRMKELNHAYGQIAATWR